MLQLERKSDGIPSANQILGWMYVGRVVVAMVVFAAAALSISAVASPMVTSMIAVGEATGGLDEMLSKIADFYDDEVDTAVGALLSLMEPVMIVVLGVIVGGMIVAMYLPIFDMINAVG